MSTVATALLLSLAGTAAEAVTIVQTLPAVLDNGDQYSGSFDISSALTDASGNQYVVTGAQLSVDAYSPAVLDTQFVGAVVTKTYQTGYACGKDNMQTCYHTFTIYEPSWYPGDGTVDILSLNSGSSSTQGASGANSTALTGSDYSQTAPANFFGNLVVDSNFSASDIASFNRVAFIPYTLSASTNAGYYGGVIDINAVTLDLTLAQVTAVPEPSAWLMMAAGVGLLATTVRSRRK